MTSVIMCLMLQAGAQGPLAPTTIEEALIEQRCSTVRSTNATGTEAYQDCLRGQIASLRADFGRDLGKLSPAERRSIDSRCAQGSPNEIREVYLQCLSTQLASLHERRNRGRTSATREPSERSSDPASSTSPAAAPTAGAGSPVAGSTLARGRFGALWIGGGLAAALTAGAWVVIARSRRTALTKKCQACGAVVTGPGNLCPVCRHEAASALRRASSERTAPDLAQERPKESSSEPERATSPEQTTPNTNVIEATAAEEPEETTPEAAPQERAEETVFDPYAVLDVSREATTEDIEAAYRNAKMKYNPDLVEGLGHALQEHYRAKVQAIERAYESLKQ